MPSRSSVRVQLVLAVGVGLTVTQSPLADVDIKQVSVTRRGGDPGGDSYYPSISSDGRHVAFASEAGNLVPGDGTTLFPDVFVSDILTGTTVRASVDIEGGDPDFVSSFTSISADGRYVAFQSYATDLVADDNNDSADIFVRDLVAGTTVRASVDVEGGDADSASWYPSITPDGRYVAFQSWATDLVEDDQNNDSDIFVRDMVAGTTVRASVDTEGGDPNGDSWYASITSDGRFLAFASNASDLVAEDSYNNFDIFVRDLEAGTTVRASVGRGGDPSGDSVDPSITPDGRYVVFKSWASDLVPGDHNDSSDIFVRDLVAGTTIRASVDTRGRQSNGDSHYPSISDDGVYVAFESLASNLVSQDGNGVSDVFIRNLLTGTTWRMSVDVRGGDPNGGSFHPSMTPDGRSVAFDSSAKDLLSRAGDPGLDVFIARW